MIPSIASSSFTLVAPSGAVACSQSLVWPSCPLKDFGLGGCGCSKVIFGGIDGQTEGGNQVSLFSWWHYDGS